MKSWKRVLAALATAALLVSNLGSSVQTVYAVTTQTEAEYTQETEDTTVEEVQVDTQDVEDGVKSVVDTDVTPEDSTVDEGETEETKVPENKTGDSTVEEPQTEEVEEPKAEETNEGTTEETKAPENKTEESKDEEPKTEETNEGTTEEPEVVEPEEEQVEETVELSETAKAFLNAWNAFKPQIPEGGIASIADDEAYSVFMEALAPVDEAYEALSDEDKELEDDDLQTAIAEYEGLYSNSYDINLSSISGPTTVKVNSSITLTCDRWLHSQSDSYWYGSDESIATVYSNRGSATVTGVRTGTVTIWHVCNNSTTQYTVTVTAEQKQDESARVFFLKYPTADPDSNSTNQWGSEVGTLAATVNMSNAVWVDTRTEKNKNVFTNLDTHVKRMPTGFVQQGDGSYLMPKSQYRSYYQEIFNAWASEFGLTSLDDLEEVYLTPYKISNNGDGKHIDCTIKVKAKTLYTVKYWIITPDGKSTLLESYMKTRQPNENPVIQTGTSKSYAETVTYNNETYYFDGWYSETDYKAGELYGDHVTFPHQTTDDEMTDATVEFYAHYVRKGGFSVIKYNADKTKTLPGAEFKLYKDYNTATKTGTLVGTYTTDANGQINVEKQLMPGKYTLVETKAPAGYQLDDTNFFQFDIKDGNYYSHEFENKQILKQVELTKTGDKGAALAGAEFTLYQNYGQTGQQQIGTAQTTDANGKLTFTDVPYGKYTAVETKAPAGYKYDASNPTNVTVTVNEESDAVVKVNATNELYKANITIKKVDVDDDSKLLDATFSLSGTTATGERYSQTDISTGSDGVVTVENVPDGTYVLVETTSPENYKQLKESDAITITITGGKITAVSTSGSADVKSHDESSLTVTNKFDPITVTVSKAWNDGDNQDGIRPTSVEIELLADGQSLSPAQKTTLSDEKGWTYTFENLPAKKGGTTIVYSVRENNVAEGYTATPKQNEDGTWTVTNYHKTATVDVTATKTWSDNNDEFKIRPENITLTLYADGEKVTNVEQPTPVKNGNTWTYTYKDLPKNKNGVAIKYTVQEDTVAGYTLSYDDGTKLKITNTLDKAEIKITKVWDDASNQDGARPDNITITLTSADQSISKTYTIAPSDTEKNTDQWTYTITDLPKSKNGETIQYTLTEATVANYNRDAVDAEKGYPTITGDAAKGFTVTNKHTPETSDVVVTKVWDDDSNRDGHRPKSITLHLYADGKEVTGVTPDKAVSEDGNTWTYTYKDLPVYASGTDAEGKPTHGNKITYTVDEDKVSLYTKTVDGLKITNTHKIETTNVVVTKVWVDGSDRDGHRPDSIKVRLYANGNELTDKTPSVTKNENDTWTLTFTDLDKYANGKAIAYTVSEDAIEIKDGNNYTTEIGNVTENKDKTGYEVTITNTHEVETTSVSGTKTWNDDNDAQKLRPASITVNLNANGTLKESKTVKAEDNWSYSWENLDKYSDGEKIAYTVTEGAVSNYNTTIEGYNITNTLAPGKTSVSVTKAWEDKNDQDGKRPTSVTITLYKNGEATDQTVTLNAENNWSATFSGLAMNDSQGKKIAYKVMETAVSGYTTAITGDAATGYTVTNTYKTATTEVSGTKTWNDADNQDGKRPESITVNLYADGELKDSKTVTAKDNWSYSWKDLDKYKNHGTAIVYTVTETAVTDYTTTYDGYNITNSHTPETVTIEGVKTWDDADDQDGKRPESITVNLLADGTKVDSKTVTAAEEWKYSFTADKYKNGKEITYTVTENEIEDYKAAVDGNNITNSYTPETTSIKVTKTWFDANNQDGTRPESIKVTVLAKAEGETEAQPVTYQEITAANNWTYTFENLPVYKTLTDAQGVTTGGHKIIYTVTEEEVEGYTTKITGDAATGFTITNTHEIDKTSVKVTKTWDHGTNPEATQPTSVEIELLADGQSLSPEKTITLTKNDQGVWTGEFTDLPVNKEGAVGQAIQYTVKEKSVKVGDKEIVYYNAAEPTGDAATGYTIKNTYDSSKHYIESDPPVEKTVSGSPSAAETFIFTMVSTGTPEGVEAPKPSNGWTQSLEIQTGTKSVEFGKLRFYEPGTYKYEVKEDTGSAANWTYDTTVFTFQYDVTRNDDNTLAVKRTINNNADLFKAVFTNTYTTPSPDPGPDPRPDPQPSGGDDTPTPTPIQRITEFGSQVTETIQEIIESGAAEEPGEVAVIEESGSISRTGDDSLMTVYGAAAAAAAGVLALWFVKRRRHA